MRSLRRLFCTAARGAAVQLDFQNPSLAFQYKSTWELLRAFVILRLCGVSYLVDNSLPLLQWVDRLGGRPLLRRTFYAQFVGGDNPTELRTCAERVLAGRMRCMIAAMLEEDIGAHNVESVYDSNCSRILTAVNMVLGESPTVQLKMSGLLPATLLVQLGKQFEASDDTQLDMVRVLSEGMKGQPIEVLNWKDSDNKVLQRALGRLQKIGEAATERKVRILVDAEQTYLNPGLSALAMACVRNFNQQESVFWNTYQCYLKDAWDKVHSELRMVTQGLNAHFGAKVVRGAYLLQERTHARAQELPDPTCPDYGTTCDMYDRVINFLLEKTSEVNTRCQFVVATHNENSIRQAIRRMKELQIDRTLVSFGQIYGMCDQVSLPLAAAGFAVYKSIPFGTVKEVLPYLARRAVENRSVLEGVRAEPRLLAAEIKNRLRPFP